MNNKSIILLLSFILSLILCYSYGFSKGESKGYNRGWEVGSKEQYNYTTKEFINILNIATDNDTNQVTGLVFEGDTTIYYMKPKTK